MFSPGKILSAWDKFFFEEKPTEGMALFRIIWMSMIFIYFLIDLGNSHDFYGPHALLSQNTVRDQFTFLHANIFNLFRPSYETVNGIMLIYGLSIVASIFGLFTRYSLILTLILMTSLHQRNIWLLSSSEMLMRAVTLMLVVSPCGHSLSVDSLLGRYFPDFRKKKMSPIWALRLIQIQISVVYLWTVWHKLQGETWLNGTAVYYATRLDSMANFTIPVLMDSLIFLKLMTWGTLLVELSLGTLIWFKKFRRPVIVAGILFHLGIEYIMSIPFFELYMIALLINFISPEELKAFAIKGMDLFARCIQNSILGDSMKEKLIRTLRGQHEPIN
jgi:hypothetical protein